MRHKWPRPRHWQFFSRRDRDETLVHLETVSRPRRQDRDHNPGLNDHQVGHTIIIDYQSGWSVPAKFCYVVLMPTAQLRNQFLFAKKFCFGKKSTASHMILESSEKTSEVLVFTVHVDHHYHHNENLLGAPYRCSAAPYNPLWIITHKKLIEKC